MQQRLIFFLAFLLFGMEDFTFISDPKKTFLKTPNEYIYICTGKLNRKTEFCAKHRLVQLGHRQLWFWLPLIQFMCMCVSVCVCVHMKMRAVLIMSVIFIIRFPVVGGLRTRDGEISVRVDLLQHTEEHNIKHSSCQCNHYA